MKIQNLTIKMMIASPRGNHHVFTIKEMHICIIINYENFCCCHYDK